MPTLWHSWRTVQNTSNSPLLILANADWPVGAPALTLPHLSETLGRWRTQQRTAHSSRDLLSPAERWHAQALGWQLDVAAPVPWGAWHARQLDLSPEGSWALISPCHWDINMTGVRMDDPAQLRLSTEHSRALMAALQPFALEDGIALHWVSPTLWLAKGAVFDALVAPSPARMANAELSDHLPDVPQNAEATRLLRRLQNEAQMLFYDHPVHDQRAAQRLPAVNSIWYHGAGPWVSPAGPTRDCVCADILALSDHLVEAWQHADAWIGQQLALHPNADLVLCQSASSRLLSQRPSAWWRRLGQRRPKQWMDLLP